MSLEDKEKWDKKYQDSDSLLNLRHHSKKLELAINSLKPSNKKALDVACGNGRNSIYLSQNSFSVDAIDISKIALEDLDNRRIKNITTKQIDLDNYIPPLNSYDIIIMCNFLDRELMHKLFHALKNDGILIIETYMQHKENEKQPSNPDYLLRKNELKDFFQNFSCELLDYDEFFNEPFESYKMMKQAIVIKKVI